MATQSKSSTRSADTEAAAPDTAGTGTTAPAVPPASSKKPPRLGTTVVVSAAPGRTVQGGARGAFGADPESVVVTLRVLRLLEDGDLLLAQ